ncbi:MAG: peptidoglycan DD-metalloendopeptidase family protein [Burkholderiaceae bacterium]|jgi:lipoprotein NlpD|nr:peptidoglycan DD-metalloendopeptidase family protein [Burkholderiaceae bacterium]
MIVSGCKIWTVLLLGCALALGGCGSTLTRAPVEDRGTASRIDPSKLPGAENAGKPGYYTVRQGDTIMRIASASGQSWRDIAQWNNLDNPNVIEVGQVLRVVPPTAATAVTSPGAAAAATSAGADSVAFMWPSTGAMIAKFDDSKNKGIDLAGKAGDPVLAAADGKVVYAGAGLRGYGNLVILKHNNTFLTAYAHNQKLLIKEDETVKKGQKIAEMGSTDADRVKLHFEVRRSGKPVDPLKYLPVR